METSPLDRPASIPLLRRLLAEGLLSPDEVKSLEAEARQKLPWSLWLDRGLLSVGVLLIVSAVVYFLANKLTLTDADKLGLSVGAVLLALIGAVWAGLDRFLGKLLLTAASVLVGVLIWVYSVNYQPGATDFELMLVWAGVIFPLTLIGRFVPLWLFWLFLINNAIATYWLVFNLDWNLNFRYPTLSILAVNLLALALREWAGWVKIPWVDRNWSAWVVLAAVLSVATTESSQEIFEQWSSLGMSFVILCLHSVVILGIVYYYSKVRPSLPALALGTLSGCWMATVLALQVVFFTQGFLYSFNSYGTWFIMGLLVLAIFSTGVFLLRWASRTIAE